MNIITVKVYKNIFIFRIGKSEYKFNTLKEGIEWYLNSFTDVYKLNTRLNIILSHKCGELLLDLRLVYACSDLILYIIDKISQNKDKLSISNTSEIKSLENNIHIGLNFEELSFDIESSIKSMQNISLNDLNKFLSETKILNETNEIVFTVETINIKVEDKNEKKPAVFIVSTFQKEKSQDYKKEFKNYLMFFYELVNEFSNS
jgi:hypothetical protein